MLKCDLNCDMGEGTGNDAAIMPYITSANIACGYHAGDETTMLQTLLLAKSFGVAAGAHPGYPDRENFGRKEMNLSPEQVYQLVMDQVTKLKAFAFAHNMQLHHVKPHGALYNTAAKDATIAKAIAKAVKDIDEKLVLFGLSGSCLIRAANELGLKTKSEVFADRTYDDDGSLTPRSKPGALIEADAAVAKQVLQMVKEHCVTTTSGKKIPIVAETICLHGDGIHAVALAKLISNVLRYDGV